MKKVPTECKIPDNLSVDQFQEQLYSIFEKKGILQDVRAFLRTQMINVVRGMQTGSITVSPQRHMQRMDISNQVMNILISEYLLRQHFSYTLSMFTSEIPLADMTFDFAKRLFSVATVSVDNTFKKYDAIHFKEHDVRDVLNILGFPRDSLMKGDIIKMYRQDPRKPLLVCIIMTLVNELNEYSECITASEDSGRMNLKDKSAAHKCAKNTNSVSEINWKDKYEKKIQELNLAYGKELNFKMKKAKDRFKQDQTTLAINMQNEWKLKEKELKNEIEQVKEGCFQQIKAIEHNVNRKKKFLWQIFKSVQEQIETLKEARDNVKKEDHRIKAKAKKMQTKITESEMVLAKKGEELNQKMKQEMLYLEDQMHNVERERRALSHERRTLHNLQSLLKCEQEALDTEKKRAVSELENSNQSKKQLQEHCETLKSQLDTFNRISMRGEYKKIFIEKSTQTDVPDPYQTCLNNVPEVSADRISSHPSISDSRDNMKQTVVNNLKKWKNVNMRNDLEVQTDVCGVARPEVIVGTGEATGLMRQILEHSQEDNRNLRAFLDLQKAQIQDLITQKVNLQSELATANLTLNNLMRMKEANERILAATPHLLRPPEATRGAGEEVGVTCSSPMTSKRKTGEQSEKKFIKYPVTCRLQMQQSVDERHCMQSADRSQLFSIDRTRSAKLKAKQSHYPSTRMDDRGHERSYKTRIKETAQDGEGEESERRRFTMEDSPTGTTNDRERYVATDKIVNAMRRRFRKLEIEAEAVDKAYRQFKTRHSDSTMSYGRCSGTTVAAAGTFLGTGEFTNLQPSYTSDILSRPIHSASQYPEYLKLSAKKSNVADIDSYKNITRLLDEPLTNFRKMYDPASTKSTSQSTAINNRLKNVKDCAVSPIFSLVSKVDGQISPSNKRDSTSDINHSIKVNHNDNCDSSFHKSFKDQNRTHSIRDQVNNVSIQILPVAIENYENFEKYIEKQHHDIETHFESNMNVIPSSDTAIDKTNNDKYMSSDLSPKRLDINFNKTGSCEKELNKENNSLNEKLDVSKHIDKNNTEPMKCECKKSNDCVCLDLQGFSVHKIDGEAKISTNGAVMVSVESALINDPVLVEPKTNDLRTPRLNIETVNMEARVSTITVEKNNVEVIYKNDGMTKERNQIVDGNLNFDKLNEPVHEIKSVPVELVVDYPVESLHLDNKEEFNKSENIEIENLYHSKPNHTEHCDSIPIETVVDTHHLEYKEDSNKSEIVKKEISFQSTLKHTDDTNCNSVPIESVVDSQDPEYKEDSNKSESLEKENSFNGIPKDREDVNSESPMSKEIEELCISQSEANDHSEISVAKDVESIVSDLSVHKASSGDSIWS